MWKWIPIALALLVSPAGAQVGLAPSKPGGANGLLQYNASNIFGGITQWSTNGTTALNGSTTALFLWNGDVAISRNAAGIIQFGTTAANASGAWLATNGTITGTLIAGTADASTSTGGALQVTGGATVAKRFWLPAITTSAGLQTAVLCQSSGGEVIADSVACLASAYRFKNVHGPMPDGALAKLARLPIDLWSYKVEGNFQSDNWTRERIGPLADDVAAMDPRLAGYDSDGNVRAYSTEQLLAYTIKAVQELKSDNDNLRAEVRRLRRVR